MTTKNISGKVVPDVEHRIRPDFLKHSGTFDNFKLDFDKSMTDINYQLGKAAKALEEIKAQFYPNNPSVLRMNPNNTDETGQLSQTVETINDKTIEMMNELAKVNSASSPLDKIQGDVYSLIFSYKDKDMSVPSYRIDIRLNPNELDSVVKQLLDMDNHAFMMKRILTEYMNNYGERKIYNGFFYDDSVVDYQVNKIVLFDERPFTVMHINDLSHMDRDAMETVTQCDVKM